MNSIIFWTVFTAIVAGFFITLIIETVSTAVKKRKLGKAIRLKPYNNTYGWIIFFGILQGLNAGTTFMSLKYSDFTESVLNWIKIVCYLLIFCECFLAYFLRTRAYLTEGGIISNYSLFPPESVKYLTETVETEIKIKLYTKKQNPYCTYLAKSKETLPMLERLYSEFDGNAPKVKIKNGTVKYLLTMLCTSLIFVGGIFTWYVIEKPVVFIGDKIVKTDSEYALFSYFGYYDLLRQDDLQYYGEIAKKAQEMFDYVETSENLTSEDMAALKKMPNLKYLDVTQNNIDDLTEIGKLTQLEGLAFGGRDMYLKPKDYLSIKNLTNLKYFCGLGLGDCNDLTIFENMDDIIYFELTAADIQKGLDVICEKENLLNLKLFRSNISDFSPIGKCKKLKKLTISETNITDLSFLKNLKELKYLNISKTNAENYSALLEMPSLEQVSAVDCDIPNEIIEKLTEKGVEIYT